MSANAKLTLGDKTFEMPIITGTEDEKAVDIRSLLGTTGHITIDDGYGNTGSCESRVTFIDGDKGILRYRGVPIEEICQHSNFIETAFFLIWDRIPSAAECARFDALITEYMSLPDSAKKLLDAFPLETHPMAVLTAAVTSLSGMHPNLDIRKPEDFERAAALLMAAAATVGAWYFNRRSNIPYNAVKGGLGYAGRFLHLLCSAPGKEHNPSAVAQAALDLMFILHADHEQNCSTSTVRMVCSSGADIYASIAAGVTALSGPLHGGANQAVLEQLTEIHESGATVEDCIRRAKDKDSGFRLMGFGHRVYKNFDPRARIIKKNCDDLLSQLGRKDPLLDIAKQLEEAALNDEYFVSRRLYPNVDFYSGIIMRALGIPVDFFTVMFAIGRMPGWIAQFKEVRDNPKTRISRPRQVYQGTTERTYAQAKG